MDLFEKYFSNINEVVESNKPYNPKEIRNKLNGTIFSSINQGISNRGNILEKAETIEKKTVFNFDYTYLSNLYGVPKYLIKEPKIGSHPDFVNLQFDQFERHYAVSMFIDIKGSTHLIKKYDLEKVRLIKDSVLTLAIYICNFFGGHIQRLQGDGIFIYFVRRSQNHRNAIISALNTASLLTFLIKYELPKYFKTEEVEPFFVRTGIDYGDKENVLWSYYGLPFCHELTTTSLHTDLAAKLQAKAAGNGIMIGDNIVEELDLQDNLKSRNVNEKFIFGEYKMWEFNWENYLLTFDFFKRNTNRKLEITTPTFRLLCQIRNDDKSEFKNYSQNLYAIPKGYKIKFILQKNGMDYHKLPSEGIQWKIKNSGREATVDNKLILELKDFNNNYESSTDAAFIGHHDMECKLIRERLDNVNVRFPVFVRDRI
jgi:adenylate cyclase